MSQNGIYRPLGMVNFRNSISNLYMMVMYPLSSFKFGFGTKRKALGPSFFALAPSNSHASY